MSKKPEYENRRPDFIIEMYRVYWANMARSMEGVWKILAPITVAGTIIAAVHKDYLPAPLGISLAFLVIFWALNMTIDLNAWHRRNLFFLVRAEQNFLRSQDYGTLLPKKYKEPSVRWITFYEINALIFLAFLFLTVLYAFIWKLPKCDFASNWLVPISVLLAGVVSTLVNARVQDKSAQKHFRELFEGRFKKNVRGGEKCLGK
jgi:hypothetical protein